MADDLPWVRDVDAQLDRALRRPGVVIVEAAILAHSAAGPERSVLSCCSPSRCSWWSSAWTRAGCRGR